ncbi:DNA mismatch repair endonuclease MutL [Thermoleptolyngbya oregonensis NK1-22]|uniref:DNA mismatch repair protein MutL n=1 Tax=Thermoleptolyngbya oregonensis NK1-22 TaxID=2547457 RepID=A0AA97BKP1_9CYAN|nr:DNA mismatch repair endonuclease MutL [Thermoleptolyngbya oregonensis]WOB42162.1 DNA mismatch repair endonuclease MutL [Thermoleptolyngbya oregonensis NK1-22]
MTQSIQPLSEAVVNLIAAGEVIDSLGAVVRELAENALDAGATHVSIAVWPERWSLRVADNGSGMSHTDLRQAAAPHSTSKIHASEDLWSIRSLGFRGEALHSLAQLADLEIGSRLADSTEGWWVRYDRQGNPVSETTVAIAPGTVVTVSHLFGNWLPRREGLPPMTQQLRAIQQVVYHLALGHPQVTWVVQQGDRPWFSLWASQTARQVLPQILRDVQPGDLVEVELGVGLGADGSGEDASPPHPPRSIVLMGLPDRCHRRRPDWVKVAVNGRVVQLPELEQTILGAFRRTLPRDRHPVCFLHLRLPPEQIDWNRHPAKAEIYLKDLDRLQAQVQEAIAHALSLHAHSLSDTAHSQRLGQVLRAAESGGGYRLGSLDKPNQPIGEDSREDSSEEPSAPAFPLSSATTPLRAIAQVHNMYILAEHPAGIWLIEQHIAHERVLYEELCDRWTVVPLDPPALLPNLSTAQVEQLVRIGLTVELFGDALWAIRTAPAPLAQREDCTEALLELSLGGDLETALVATACRTAIRNGTPLALPELQTLLDRWQQTRNPHTCPHGRPICLSLQESSLSRFFRRHWVIGKSHGI